VIDVALLSVIRRWHLREGVSIREIARRTQLSRNTIRKYLADGTLQPSYPKRKSPSKLDPYSEMLASWLERESTRGRKQRRNWRQLFDDLVALATSPRFQ
jgi:transposase